MNDTAKVASAIFLIALGIFSYRRGMEKNAQSEDFPDGTFWICLECKHEFNMSREAVATWVAANPDKSVPCPNCGANKSVRAERSPVCGKYYIGSMIEIDGVVCCPICKEPVP